MSDTPTNAQSTVEIETPETPEVPAVEPIPGEDALGDPGKKALDSMKAKWKEAEKRAKEIENELAALKAAAEGRESEHKAAAEAQRVRDEALAKANDRIKRSEIRAAAKGELTNPEDVFAFIDLESIEVDDDGAVDSAAVQEAIKTLLQERPYLAAQSTRFKGAADSGYRNDARPAQLTQADLKSMSPAQIEKARKEGRLSDLLGKK